MLTVVGYLVRLLFSLFLVFGMYNPTGYSYYHWLELDTPGGWPLKVFVGVVFGFLLFTHIQATFRSMSWIGTGLVTLVVAAAIWVLVDYDLIDLAKPETLALTLLSGFAMVIGTGLSWSLVRYRISGQVDSQNLVG